MTVQALSAAKRICEVSDWSLTNLRVQKILYVAHMFYMGQNDGTPLVTGHFEAWDYGPVHPRVYHVAKVSENRPVEPHVLKKYSDLHDGSLEREYLDGAVEKLPLKKLVAITHWEGGAWYKNYEPGEVGIVIPNPDIIEEYKKRADAAKAAEN